MKKMVMVLVLLLFTSVAGSLWAKDFEVAKKAGDYNVLVRIDKNPPIAGDNGISIVLKDAKGAEVKDAKVAVEYSMPPMPGMPATNYKASMELNGSEYKGKVNFSMSGPWNVVVRVSRGDKKTQAKINVDVR